MPGQNRYGYGASQADRLQREHVEPFAAVQEGAGGTTEADVIASIIDAARTEYEDGYGIPDVSSLILHGYLFAGVAGTDYPSASEFATRYGELCKAATRVLEAFAGYPSCNSNQPLVSLPLAVVMPGNPAAGTFADYIAGLDIMGVDGYPDDLNGDTHTPYINSVATSSQLTAMLDIWGGLSAFDSTHPVDVTPAGYIGWSPINDGIVALNNWLTDLAAGAGTGSIYCSDV